MEQQYKVLEEKYAEFVGADFAVSVNSGTSALHIALLCAGVGAGDEVIVPDWTMAAVPFAVSYTGARVVCADVLLDTGCIDPQDVKKKLTSKTKAIIAVDTYGRLANMVYLRAIADESGVVLIEDGCEAQGAATGKYADMAVWSFFKNKIIHAEEGGMMTTDSEERARKAEYLKNMAFNDSHNYFHEHVGYNYRMPNLEAEMAIDSLSHYRDHAEARRRVESWYNYYLGLSEERPAVWFFDYFCGIGRKSIILRRIDDSRDSFKPISTFPMYRQDTGPVSAFLSANTILLPVRPEMTLEDVRVITKQL